VKGTPNRSTVEKMRRAELDVVAARARGEKLGKETLRAYMLLFDERADFWHRAAEITEAVVRCWGCGRSDRLTG
jgi:hypothetical protein